MSTYTPRFITPPADEQELYPYRPVWRSFAIEASIIAAVTLALYIVVDLLRFAIPARLQTYASLGLLITPLVLWSIFSLQAEHRANQPRRRLLAVAILTLLATNSVGIPLLDNYFLVDSWLPLAPAVNRILGYTVTAGMIQGALKYIILRYTIWPNDLRERLDGIAYGITTGIAYATILNIQFYAANTAAPADTVAFHVFANYALHVTTGLVIGYGLSEVKFGNPTPIFLSLIVLVSAVITGIVLPIHAGLINASLTITPLATVSAPKPLLGIGLSVALLVVVSVIIAGLIQNADRLEREAQASREN